MTEKAENLDALNNISADMHKRLKTMIDRKDPHFILTGSDPAEAGGCCPCNEVGHGNSLVENGILETWQSCGGEDSCPSRFYAFRGEKSDATPPEFKPNEALRGRVAERLGQPKSAGVKWRQALKYLLLVFAAVCLVMVVVRERGHEDDSVQDASAVISAAGVEMGDGYLVCIIKTAHACSACEAMETYARQALTTHYSDEIASGRIRFMKLSAVGDINSDFREAEGILATSLVLMEIKDGAVVRRKTLTEAWMLLQTEEAFVDMVRDASKAFMEEAQ